MQLPVSEMFSVRQVECPTMWNAVLLPWVSRMRPKSISARVKAKGILLSSGTILSTVLDALVLKCWASLSGSDVVRSFLRQGVAFPFATGSSNEGGCGSFGCMKQRSALMGLSETLIGGTFGPEKHHARRAKTRTRRSVTFVPQDQQYLCQNCYSRWRRAGLN